MALNLQNEYPISKNNIKGYINALMEFIMLAILIIVIVGIKALKRKFVEEYNKHKLTGLRFELIWEG